MLVKQCCSLCCSKCDDYKLLKNESGENNKYYETTVKYFDPMLLTDEANSNIHHIQVLCQECWYHINEFHEFQETVLKTRILEHNEHIETLPIEIEDCENVDTNTHSNTSFDVSYDEDDRLDYFENQCLQTESMTMLEDTTESIHNQANGKEKEPKKTTLSQEIDKTKDEDDRLDYFENQCLQTEPMTMLEDTTESIDNQANGKEKEPNKSKLSQEIDKTKDQNELPYTFRSDRKPKEKKTRVSDAFIAEWKPELVCDICSEAANNFDKLRSHFKEKHKTRFYIKCCEKKFVQRNFLVNHIQLHLNPETNKCHTCGKPCTTKQSLKQHMKQMHEDTKQLKCDICDKLFKRKYTLERHLLTHATGSKDFICSECGKGYVDEELLKLHVKSVHNVDRVCDQCGKTYHGLYALKKHLMDHAGIERPKFPCDVCGLKLSSISVLKRHKAFRHNDGTTGIEIRKFSCDVCGFELMSINSLKRHQASYHSDGTTIYVCGVCGKVTANEYALAKHKRVVHVDERKHKCTYCEKAFKSPKSLREHIAAHTGKRLYQCTHCPQTFKGSSSMYNHRRRVHPVEYEEAKKNRLQHPKINSNQVKKLVVI